MKVKEMIELLKQFPEDQELVHVGYDRGHGYTREVVSEIAGISMVDGNLVFIVGNELPSKTNITFKEKLRILQDMYEQQDGE